MTQLLCAIPGCRIPGEHRPDCDGNCRYGCQPRLAEDGYACDSCVGHLHQLLGVITGLAPDARAVAAGQIRRGPSAGGGGKPGSRPPLDAGATDALDEITASLAKIARGIAHVRGLRAPQSHTEARTLGDPLGALCAWLSDSLEWVRHAKDDQSQPYAPTVHTAIRDAANRIRAIVNGPHARRYLGPCGAQQLDDITQVQADEGEGIRTYAERTCDGDVYGRPGATNGTCRTCHAQHAQHDRQVWIGDITRNRAYRASEIEHAHGIRAHTIRMWANRGLIAVHDHDHLGRQRYLLGDALDQAARMAARRSQLEAKRTARAVAEMGTSPS